MIENTKIDHLSLLIQQHHDLKELSNTAQEIMETASFAELKKIIQYLFQRTIEHVDQEEEILFPLLKDMYYPNDREISSFPIEEHAQIRKQLDVLVHELEAAEKQLHQPNLEYSLQCILINQLEHMFKEEQVLFPLIKKHLSRTAKESRHLPS